MSLQIGQQVNAELLRQCLTVRQRLGEGTQGEVYLVDGPGGEQVIKWYKPPQATDEQRAAIILIVQRGPPQGDAGRRFVWPEDLVTVPGNRQFGYLMRRIDTKRFCELGYVWAHPKVQPNFATLCRICHEMCRSYRALHRTGYCYRDISAGNLLFDPQSGEILICDNDNIGVNRQSKCQVWGTIEYMAPELIRGEAAPSTETDLHSLAVFLFLLWVWHHPMHGKMEYEIRAWDLPAKKKVYGTTPVFVFHPTDNRNELPNDPDYATARKRWNYCPGVLQEYFLEAFMTGLVNPASRVSESRWESLFLQLADNIIPCPACQAHNLWDPASPALTCWHCRRPVALPPKLMVVHPGGKNYLLLRDAAKILRRHVDPYAPDGETVIGEVVRNPNNPQVWGIRNLTASPWSAVMPDGTAKDIPPQRAVPINPGIKIGFGKSSAEISP